jgi:hypothetical protein
MFMRRMGDGAGRVAWGDICAIRLLLLCGLREGLIVGVGGRDGPKRPLFAMICRSNAIRCTRISVA